VIQAVTKFQNKTAEHQPLHLDSKPRAWGAVDRHNIPKGQRALPKGSNALQKDLGGLQKGSKA